MNDWPQDSAMPQSRERFLRLSEVFLHRHRERAPSRAPSEPNFGVGSDNLQRARELCTQSHQAAWKLRQPGRHEATVIMRRHESQQQTRKLPEVGPWLRAGSLRVAARASVLSRGDQGVSQPFGFSLARCSNGARHFTSFLGWQSHAKNDRSALCREWRSTLFIFHTSQEFCIRKRKPLTSLLIIVYKCQASKFKAEPFQQGARTSLERLITRDTRLSPGRAVKRLAMQAEAYQAGIPTQKTRSLKVEFSGDFFKRSLTAKIRLAGKWLENAGFKPGHRVQVVVEKPGCLSLHFKDQGTEVAR